MNLFASLSRQAKRSPNHTALALGTQALLSYADLAQQAMQLGAGLRAMGLKEGARVALFLPNSPAYFVILYACWAVGLVAVPINAKLHPRELDWILENCDAQLCFVSRDGGGPQRATTACMVVDSPEYLQRCAHNASTHYTPAHAAELAWLFYTSGTTGTPKGAMLTHQQLHHMIQAYYADIDPLDTSDSILHAAPLSHGSGLYGLAHLSAGSRNVIPTAGGFDADEVFELLHCTPNLSFFAAPTMVLRLLGHAKASPSPNLKTLIYGGAPMYLVDTLRAVDLFGPHLYNLYGQGESPMTITGLSQQHHTLAAHASHPERLTTCGQPRHGVAVRVVDAQGHDLAPHQIGEIITRSDCVMSGYWNNPSASASAIKDDWLYTGDLGSLDTAGYLKLQDRAKDLIISGGSNIYPREVEEVLLKHPAVSECAVIGIPDTMWGEAVVAFVVCHAGEAAPQSTSLETLCLENIARFKRPKHYRFVTALPKNNYGKVLKTELRTQFEATYNKQNT